MQKMEIRNDIFEASRAEAVKQDVGAEQQAECVLFLESVNQQQVSARR